jgi:nucleoside-diphosphate-sugar epimerase
LARLLILGSGYLGAALAERALAAGEAVVMADNWHASDRAQLESLEAAGAVVERGDIRRPDDLDRLLALRPGRVYLLAAQASRPLAEREPDYTEETNVTGARRVAEAASRAGIPALVYASSLHVYGSPRGDVDADHPYGPQRDLVHLSKVYAELCLRMHAERAGFRLAILRLGIVYGPSPVEHERPESQTVVDKFRRLAAEGGPLPLDDGGQATIGVVHVGDVARIMLESPTRSGTSIDNVVAETLTVADVGALARGDRPTGERACTFRSRFGYEHGIADYLRVARRRGPRR